MSLGHKPPAKFTKSRSINAERCPSFHIDRHVGLLDCPPHHPGCVVVPINASANASTIKQIHSYWRCLQSRRLGITARIHSFRMSHYGHPTQSRPPALDYTQTRSWEWRQYLARQKNVRRTPSISNQIGNNSSDDNTTWSVDNLLFREVFLWNSPWQSEGKPSQRIEKPKETRKVSYYVLSIRETGVWLTLEFLYFD